MNWIKHSDNYNFYNLEEFKHICIEEGTSAGVVKFYIIGEYSKDNGYATLSLGFNNLEECSHYLHNMLNVKKA